MPRATRATAAPAAATAVEDSAADNQQVAAVPTPAVPERAVDARTLHSLDSDELNSCISTPETAALSDSSSKPIPSYLLAALLTVPCTFSTAAEDRQALREASILSDSYNDEFFLRVSSVLAELGALPSKANPLTWPSYVRGCASARRRASAQQRKQLVITAADLKQNESFDRPALAAAPAASGGGVGLHNQDAPGALLGLCRMGSHPGRR